MTLEAKHVNKKTYQTGEVSKNLLNKGSENGGYHYS